MQMSNFCKCQTTGMHCLLSTETKSYVYAWCDMRAQFDDAEWGWTKNITEMTRIVLASLPGDQVDCLALICVNHAFLRMVRKYELITHFPVVYADLRAVRKFAMILVWCPACTSPITCCLAPRARRARASQMTIPPLSGGPQPRKSGWVIAIIHCNKRLSGFAYSICE